MLKPLTIAGWFFKMNLKTRVESKNSIPGKGATSKEEGFMCHGVPGDLGRLKGTKQVKKLKKKRV